MKHIKLFEQWLNEDEGRHSYGCMMLQLKFPMDEVQSMIEDKDVYAPKDEERSFGRETDPHVTLLYGIHDDEVSDDEVFACCEKIEFPVIRLHNVSCFENEKYDVLKFDADCEELHTANKNLTKMPYTNQYPDYHPHATIAYLIPGSGKKYVEKMKDVEYEASPVKFEYSKSDGEKEFRDVKIANQRQDI